MYENVDLFKPPLIQKPCFCTVDNQVWCLEIALQVVDMSCFSSWGGEDVYWTAEGAIQIKSYSERSCWQRGLAHQSKWILSKTELMIIELYQTLWLIYVKHGFSCLLMQLFTYLLHRVYLGFCFLFSLLWLDMKQDQTGWSEFYTQKICFKVEPNLERYLKDWVIKNLFINS